MNTFITAILSGLISGVAPKLTSGSVFGVALLVYLVGLDVYLVIGISLIAVGISALVSSLHHTKRGMSHTVWPLLISPTGISRVYTGSYSTR